MKFLPNKPNIDYLRREARHIKSKHRARDNSIAPVVGHFDTSFHHLSADEIFARPFSILDAQRVVARQYGFASWARIRLYVDRANSRPSHMAQELRNQLLERGEKLNKMIEAIKSSKDPGFYWQCMPAYSDETADFMNPVFDQYGWPGPELIGADGAEACFNIVAGAATSASLNNRASELMKDVLADGAVHGYRYAMLSDRYLALSGEHTVYGITPGFDEDGRLVLDRSVVIDPDNLDKRRATAGYEPFDIQSENYHNEAKENGWDTGESRSKLETHARALAERGGYI